MKKIQTLIALAAFGAIAAFAGLVIVVALIDGAYRSLIRQKATAIVIAGATTPEERAEKIFEYVVANTPFPVQGVAGDPQFPQVMDDSAWGTLIRGRGFCDSQAMAVVQMLEDAGMEGQVLFLRREDGVSPHTVATVRINDRWMILDPLLGAIPRNSRGEWLSRDEMAAVAETDSSAGYSMSRLRLEQGYQNAFVPGALFIKATPFYETAVNRATTSLPRRAIDTFLGTFQSVIWPGVKLAEDLFVTAPRYLSNDPQPGDVQYERGRRDLLLNDRAAAERDFREARNLGTQWVSRINPALRTISFTGRDLHAPLVSQGTIPSITRETSDQQAAR